MGELLSLILDVVVLSGLGITIYFCMRLSKSLDVFRSSRDEFARMVQELSQSIATAEVAIQGLKNTAGKSGRELQDIIDDARLLSDELQLVNQTSDSLASRLESLAERSRKVAQGIDAAGVADGGDQSKGHDFSSALNAVNKKTQPAAHAKSQSPSKSPFFIQDREFEEDYDEDFSGGAYSEYDDGEAAGLKSKAEKELFEALKKSGKSKAV